MHTLESLNTRAKAIVEQAKALEKDLIAMDEGDIENVLVGLNDLDDEQFKDLRELPDNLDYTSGALYFLSRYGMSAE